ncbi:MAG: hypothetical protein MZV63_40110 [Marinilabiliales bacterium]|nr:hypothetical protein [Marinilabiliales bacterium]
MRSLARRIVDRRVLHLIKMWLECTGAGDRRPRTRQDHAPTEAKRSAARHPAGFTHLTTAGQSVHAPVRAGVEDSSGWRRALRQPDRDLRRRPRDPAAGRAGPKRRWSRLRADSWLQAEADGQRGQDTRAARPAGRDVRLPG